MRYAALLLALLILPLGNALHAQTTKLMRFGTLHDFQLQDDVELQWDAKAYGAEPTLEEGQKFAVVTVTPRTGASIGKYDYTLGGSKCLAMALADQPFNPATWEHIQEENPVDARLLYVVSEESAPFFFQLDYKVPSVTEPGVMLGTVEEPPPAEAPAEGEAGEEGEVAADGEAAAADGEAAAEDAAEPAPEPAAAEPEAKPEAEKKPEPKPEPKPEKKPEPKPEEKPAVNDELIW